MPRLAYFSVAVILAALVLPEVYWKWLETRTFVALDMPVSLPQGEIRTPDFPINLKGWYQVVVWVDSDFSGCRAAPSDLALVSRSIVYSNGDVIESSEGRDRYLGHFYAAKKARYAVTTETTSDPTCLNAGHPRIGVWTQSSGYVHFYNELRNAGILIATICLGVLAFSFSSSLKMVALFAPTPFFAPEACLRMEDGAHETVGFRRRPRLPLERKFTTLPNRGLVGGAMILLLLLPAFVMVTEHDRAKGIYVPLVPRRYSGPDANCVEGPIVIAVKQHGLVSQLFLNGSEVGSEQLETALKSKLAERANWEVFVEGDGSVPFADPMFAIGVINSLHARAVILTPKLKEEMAKACPSH